MSFIGQRVLVTGGTRGIGLEIARSFLCEGASLVLFGRHKISGKRALLTLRPLGDVDFFCIDVSNFQQVFQCLSVLIEKGQGIDILINNAGMTKDRLFWNMCEEDWNSVLEANLKSVYNVTRSLISHMKKIKKGKIVTLSSIVGPIIGSRGQVNYATSKAAISGFTRSLAREVAPYHINVNCIAPGCIKTDLIKRLPEKRRNFWLQQIPCKRFGLPEEIAKLVLFLSSNQSDYITGQTIVIDGGMTA